MEKESQDPCECLSRLSGGALKAEAPREVQGASKPLHLEVNRFVLKRSSLASLLINCLLITLPFGECATRVVAV